MATNYVFNNREHKFILKEWLNTEKLAEFERFKGYYDVDDVDMLLDVVLEIATEVVAPTVEDGEENPMRLEDGRVTVPDSFRSAYKFLVDNGWGPSNANEQEGVLPQVVFAMCEEFLGAANYPLMQFVGLTSGSAGLIQSFGHQEVQDLYLPKMFSGQWAGTMCLTEPGGGSDVGDIQSVASPTDDPGVYQIKGVKCFISQGDHDLTENIVHLLLARSEGGAPGTKGISLFVVPKYWPDENGDVGEWNDVTTIGIEHKMGMSGSATAMLGFGDNDDCRGILLGSPPDENGAGEGMAQMFQMVNGARMSTGHTALAIAATGYHSAVQYAKERVQGRKFGQGKKAPRVRIIEHEDVRRMLMVQKSTLEAMRAIIYQTYYYFDVAKYSQDEAERERARRRMEVNTPLVKAYCSDTAWQLAAEAIQVHGGYGYSEEYPVARCARDVKILSIWEGTNFIQSLDLIGRKWHMEKGVVFQEWLADIEDFLGKHEDAEELGKEMNILAGALEGYKELRSFLLESLPEKPQLTPLYSTRVLHSTAIVYCGMLLLEQAIIARERAADFDVGDAEHSFYTGKVETARFYLRNIVPQVLMTRDIILDADTSAIEIPEDAF